MHVALICNNLQLSTTVLRSLNANGIKPLLICNSRCFAILRASNGTQGIVEAGDVVTEPAKVVEAIRQHDAVHHIDQLLAADIHGLKVLDDIRKEVTTPIYPMPHRDMLEMLNDKVRFHQLLARLGFPAPISRAYPCLRSIDIDDAGRKIGFPMVVRPVSGCEIKGLRIANDKAELFEICNDRSYPYGPVVVRQYIEGSDVGISVFAKGGNSFATSTFFRDSHGVTDFVDIPALAAIVRKIIRAAAYDGIANFEAKIDRAGRLWVLECNPRFFVRLTANRLCGLDLLSLGLPGASADSSVPTGCYYPPAYVARVDGIRKLMTGEWPVSMLMRSMADTLQDPRLVLMPAFHRLRVFAADLKGRLSTKLARSSARAEPPVDVVPEGIQGARAPVLKLAASLRRQA